jgi:F420-0:gamma-glutamyl ligase-like protein
MLDEAAFEPSFTARVIAKYWMRWGWGYFFGVDLSVWEAAST